MLLAIRRWRSERSTSACVWKFSESVRRFSIWQLRPAAGAMALVVRLPGILDGRRRDMSRKNGTIARQFRPPDPPGRPKVPRMKQAARLQSSASQVFALLACGAACALLTPARAQTDTSAPTPSPLTVQLARHVQAVALDNVGAPRGARVELEVGELDPRLKLAPCERIEPFVP